MSFCRLCCCCGLCAKGEEDGADHGGEADYLLPGGEWDPSVAVVRRTQHNRTKGQRRRQGSDTRSKEFGDTGESAGAYVPPEVPGSTSLPKFQDFKMLKTVGKGAFGKVMLCVHSSTNVLYAMKVVPKSKITTQKQVTQILSELKILKKIQHPFCVTLKTSFQDENYLFYLFQFAAGGMLFYHLKQDGKFTEGRARFYMGEIVLALDYLHGFSIIFRDLKPENCMLSEQGHVILTDFGSARTLEHRERANTLAGTPHYMAPEVLRGEPYNYSADWWSSGVLLYEMLTGKAPFNSADRADLYKMVLRCDFKVPGYVSPRARSLLYKLINKDPDFRLGCGGSSQAQAVLEIKEHTFFSTTPMDPDEEIQHITEEAEHERHRQALERSRRSHHHTNGSFMGAASSVFRNISRTRRLTSSLTYQGCPCEWTWEDLEGRHVMPPFKPQLRGPTDLRHFDPIITCVPATVPELITTEHQQNLHIDGFDYVTTEPSAQEDTKQQSISVASGSSGGGGKGDSGTSGGGGEGDSGTSGGGGEGDSGISGGGGEGGSGPPDVGGEESNTLTSTENTELCVSDDA